MSVSNEARRSFFIRLMRIISIEFIVLIFSMIIGGAIACSYTEGRKGIESIHRILYLILCQRGHFFRVAVYALPKCVVLFSTDILMFWGAVVLPFLISHYALSFWFFVLSPVTSLLVRIIRVIGLIIVGLVPSGLLFLFIQKPEEFKLDLNFKWRLALVLSLFSTMWFFWMMPLLYHYSIFSNQLPFVNWLACLKMTTPVPLPIIPVLGSICIGILWLLAKYIGRWFFLYPLAYGVFTFFHLRQEAEGLPHRSPADPTVAARRSGLMGLGGNLFKTGGIPSVLHDIHPPRGWTPLLWIPIAPRTYLSSCILVIAMMFCNYPVVNLHGIWRVLWLCSSSLILSAIFFPSNRSRYLTD